MKLKYGLEDSLWNIESIGADLDVRINFYNAGVLDPFEMDCVSMRNPYNHLEKHTPLTIQTSYGFKTTFKKLHYLY